MPRAFSLSVRADCSLMRGAELPPPAAPCSVKCCVGWNVNARTLRGTAVSFGEPRWTTRGLKTSMSPIRGRLRWIAISPRATFRSASAMSISTESGMIST